MTDAPSVGSNDRSQLLAGLRRDFARALPDRLSALRAALDACATPVHRTVIEQFYFKAHALTGTAASYGATELVEPAARLASLARAWLERESLSAAELTTAHDGLTQLEKAVSAYQARVANGTG